MRVGQPVEVRADVYGRSVKYHGKLVGLSAGSGSAFALLPAQNASGNWIKIVQRVPLRIEFERGQDVQRLRSGMSVTVEIDTGRRGRLARLLGSSMAAQDHDP